MDNAGAEDARERRLALPVLRVNFPVVLGAGGMQRVIEITLTDAEKAAFQKSAASVRELVDKLA